MPQFITHFGELRSDGTYYFSRVRSGLIVGIFSIGAGIGGIFFARVGDRYGRKMGIMIGCAVYIIGILFQISAVAQWHQFLIGRVFGGLGVGTLAVLVPMFQSETSPQEVRGALVSMYQLFITLGIFVGYCVCYGTNTRQDTGSYRIPLGFCFLWALILIIGMVFIPESPRYLISKGRVEEARKSMCFVNRCVEDDPLITITVDNIIRIVEYEREAGLATWKELITGQPRIRYRLLVGVSVLTLQQLVGANYFFYYGTKVFRDIGMTDSFATSMIFGAVNFLSTFFGLFFVEKFGRRKVLFYGAFGMLLFFVIYSSLGAMALYPHGEGNGTNNSVGKGMIAVTCFYIFCFAASWAPCAFVLVSEIFPLRIRSKGM